jgi:hypothetical protein
MLKREIYMSLGGEGQRVSVVQSVFRQLTILID